MDFPERSSLIFNEMCSRREIAKSNETDNMQTELASQDSTHLLDRSSHSVELSYQLYPFIAVYRDASSFDDVIWYAAD